MRKQAHLVLILLLCFAATSMQATGQTYNRTIEWQKHLFKNLNEGDFKDSLLKYDFGLLWTKTENRFVYGFIGENYQRIRIKIISVKKDATHNDTYLVSGKSMVKNNICDFKGTIKIKSIRAYKEMHWGVDDEYKDKGIKEQGILIASYHFTEDSLQDHSGKFEGELISSWYIDKSGQPQYDDIEKNSDPYSNNQFVGTWTNYLTHQKKVCNWGDYRAPNCGNLDQGAAEFSPNDVYLQYGWQKQEEKREWWKN